MAKKFESISKSNFCLSQNWDIVLLGLVEFENLDWQDSGKNVIFVNLKKLFVSQKLLIELLNVLQEILAKGGMEQKHSLKILLLRKKTSKEKLKT